MCINLILTNFSGFAQIQDISNYKLFIFRSSRSLMFFKIGVLKNVGNFTGKHLFWSLFLTKLQALLFLKPRACNFIKKETPTQVFFCAICYIFKNTKLEEHLRTSAPAHRTLWLKIRYTHTFRNLDSIGLFEVMTKHIIEIFIWSYLSFTVFEIHRNQLALLYSISSEVFTLNLFLYIYFSKL